MNKSRWSRILVWAGLAAMLVGAIDPLEGSVVILAGIIMITVGGLLGGTRYKKLLIWSLVLVAAGIGTMVVMSYMGGLGDSTGRSMWWALVLVPYPVGWVMGLVGGIRTLREWSKTPAKPEGL